MGVTKYSSFLFLFIFSFLGSVVKSQTKTELKEINIILEQTLDKDQNTRDYLDTVLDRYGAISPEYRKALLEMNKQDTVNQSIVFPILDKYGWIGNEKISNKACSAFFYVIQHSDLDSQIKYQQRIKEAFNLKYINPYEYSIFIDRLNVRQNKYQTYGSQNELDQLGNKILYPVLDIKHLDKRLEKLGLEPKYKELEEEYQLLNVNKKDKVFIVRTMDKSMTQPVSNVNLYVNDKFIGKTDDKGILQCKLNRIKF